MPKVGTQQPPKLKASDCIVSARKSLEGNRLLLAKKALDLGTAYARKEKSEADLKQIEALRKQLDEAQDKLLKDVEKDLAAGKHFEALKRWHSYARKFAGLRIAEAATKRIAEARGNPALRSVEKRAEAEAAYAEVQDLLEAQWQQMRLAASCDKPAPPRPGDKELAAAMPVPKQAAVLDLLRYIVASCPGTSAATKAGALDEALRANKRLVDGVEKWRAEQGARGLFLKASLYESSKAKDKAVEAYRLLLEKYPECKYAATARRKLKILR